MTSSAGKSIGEQISKGKLPYHLRAMGRTARKIATHVKLANELRGISLTPVPFRTLREKTGLKFGSGAARKAKRGHARLVFSILKKKQKR